MDLHLQSYKKIFTLCGRAGQKGQGTYGGGGEEREDTNWLAQLILRWLNQNGLKSHHLKLCCRTNLMVMFNNFVSTASIYIVYIVHRDVSKDADLHKSIKITGTSKAHLRFFI